MGRSRDEWKWRQYQKYDKLTAWTRAIKMRILTSPFPPHPQKKISEYKNSFEVKAPRLSGSLVVGDINDLSVAFSYKVSKKSHLWLLILEENVDLNMWLCDLSLISMWMVNETRKMNRCILSCLERTCVDKDPKQSIIFKNWVKEDETVKKSG